MKKNKRRREEEEQQQQQLLQQQQQQQRQDHTEESKSSMELGQLWRKQAGANVMLNLIHDLVQSSKAQGTSKKTRFAMCFIACAAQDAPSTERCKHNSSKEEENKNWLLPGYQVISSYYYRHAHAVASPS
jgi:FKBP-type peptidyl-prolyl cis-trans isomerase (trigger factor)